jgi:hypothetical protein
LHFSFDFVIIGTDFDPEINKVRHRIGRELVCELITRYVPEGITLLTMTYITCEIGDDIWIPMVDTKRVVLSSGQ